MDQGTLRRIYMFLAGLGAVLTALGALRMWNGGWTVLNNGIHFTLGTVMLATFGALLARPALDILPLAIWACTALGAGSLMRYAAGGGRLDLLIGIASAAAGFLLALRTPER